MEQSNMTIKLVEVWYSSIIKERDKRLAASRVVGDYHFAVAHGLTESIRLFDESGLNEEFNKFKDLVKEMEKELKERK